MFCLGIGAAVASAFARSGCTRFTVTDLNKDTLAQTRDRILRINPDAKVLAEPGDISDKSHVESLITQTVKRFERLDYAVNCAGILGSAVRSTDMDTEDFDKITNVNYRGSWLSSRAALRVMLQQNPLQEHPEQRGAVVNIASQLGIVARPEAGKFFSIYFYDLFLTSVAAYCASKAAIIHMTRSDAIDYSKDNIRVNCVCPGVIESPMTTGTKEVTERLRPAIEIAPMRRMGRPDEVANAVMFLCSSQASFIQGHALVVDGGYTIN